MPRWKAMSAPTIKPITNFFMTAPPIFADRIIAAHLDPWLPNIHAPD
jgi:hypothetical protein